MSKHTPNHSGTDSGDLTVKSITPSDVIKKMSQIPFAGTLITNKDSIEVGTWQEILLDYEVGSSGIADGATFKITFKFYSDWAVFQTVDPQGANYVSVEYQAGELTQGQSSATVQHLSIRFDQKGHERPYQKALIVDVIDGYLNVGDHILIRLGDRRAGGPGTRVQTFVDDDFRFRGYIDPLGTSRYVAIPNDVSIRFYAGPPERIVLYGPRFARPNTPLEFRASLLDRWGNITNGPALSGLITASKNQLVVHEREITFPVTGWATVGFEYISTSEGEHEIRALISDSAIKPSEAFISFFNDAPAPRTLYADLHVHAHDTVGTNSPCYNGIYARDIGAVDIFGYTANDFQITDQNWSAGVNAVNELNQPGRFVTYPVQEWCGSSTAGGDHKVIFLGDEEPDFPYNPEGEHNRTLLWNEDMKTPNVELGRWPVSQLWSAYEKSPENHLIVPHVGGRRYIADWHHPELERLVEIASAWGHFPWLYDDVISRGYQLGVCANSDEHRGRPGGGAPGVQVFGVTGGLTGVIAEQLDRDSVGKALRARHTFATTGEHSALIVQSYEYIQGDTFDHKGPAEISYKFLGKNGFDEIGAYDHNGTIWRRNFHRELGYSNTKIRLRWGGARIKDRYRWASWKGTLEVLGAQIRGYQTYGLEHCEENVWRAGQTKIGFQSETYGDADSLEIEISALGNASFIAEGTIGGFVKVGDPRFPAPFVHSPHFRWEVHGRELIEKGEMKLDLGGVELFVALERITDKPLPRDISGIFTAEDINGPHGFRPIFLYGRQRDDSKVWSSALFIRFQDSTHK